MAYLHPDDIDPIDIDHGGQTLSIPSGAVLSGAVQAGDDSAPPVDIEWTSNKSSGWIQLGIGNHAWNDIFVQGAHVNGQHLSIEDRHQAKPLTVYSLQLNLTDTAENALVQDWDVIVVNATDSSGNTGTHSMLFVVEPPIGAFYRITNVVKVGDGGPGDSGALDVTLENDGQGESYFRLCYLTECTTELMAVEASVDGPGQMTHRIMVEEWASGDVIVVIEFPDNTSQEHLSNLTVQAEMTPMMWILLLIPPIVGLLALWRLKRQPEDDLT